VRRRAGAAFVFERRGNGWNRVARLSACGAEAGTFGDAVAVAGGVVAVGAHDFDGGAAAGDVWMFTRGDGSWPLAGHVVPSDAAPAAQPIGSFVALSQGDVLVGVPAQGRVEVFDAAAPLPPPAECVAPPTDLVWPGDEWLVEKPDSHGMDPIRLDRARRYAFERGNNTQAVVVVRQGVIVAEWYEDGRDASSFGASWSVAKSFASAVVGIAIGQGLIDGVHAPMTTFFPDWTGTPKDAMTLQDVLAMASGLDWSEDYSLQQTELSDIAYLAVAARDHLAYTASQPLLYPPGTFFYYSSGDSMLLSGVLEAATGETAGDYARRVLFDPIGMRQAQWWTDTAGHTLTYCCIDAPARDMARFGLLYARGGRWKDEQVVPADWVRESTTPTAVSGNSYGYQWWLYDFLGWTDSFLALGVDSQYIYVFPSLDLVVVRQGHYDKDPGPPIADPSLFARYPARGLVRGHGTVKPDDGWDHLAFLRPILDSIGD
jgi:CubicO group peptidase (beta-lactamase class C family)